MSITDTPAAMRVGEFVVMLRSDMKQDRRYRDVVITGEVGRITVSGPGHWYFDLKDADGLLNCVAWRSAAARIGDPPKVGDEVLVVGSLDVYPARGSIQLVISEMRTLSGLGALEETKRRLVETLRSEGLLDRPRNPLPAFPRHLCLVTGAGSAALADMQRLIDERWPGLRRTVIGVLVQGERAAREIVRGVEAASRMSDPAWAEARGVPPVDLIICGRGGGGPEDLWAFNLEPVARSFIGCPVPIVSAVGHESDVLISDMVADLRAATPSHAIERCVPPRFDLEQRCDEYAVGMETATLRRFARIRDSMGHLRARLGHAPMAGVVRGRSRIDSLSSRMAAASRERVQREHGRLQRAEATLYALHPNRVAERGWALVRDESGALVTRAAAAPAGASIRIRFHDGSLSADVTQQELDADE